MDIVRSRFEIGGPEFGFGRSEFEAYFSKLNRNYNLLICNTNDRVYCRVRIGFGIFIGENRATKVGY